MSRTSRLLVVLIVVLTASACASAVASAAGPELRANFLPMKYSGTIISAGWEAPTRGFRCLGNSTSEGEITGKKTMTAVIHFRGCEEGGSKCTSEGAAAGEIVTQPLEGSVVADYNGAAVVFKPKTGINIVNSFQCLLVKGEVRGTVLAELYGGEGKPTTELKLAFSGNTEYTNESKEKVNTALETNWPGGTFTSLHWTFNNTLKLLPRGEEPGLIELYKVFPTSPFTVSGGAATLEDEKQTLLMKCKALAGNGQFENAREGTMTLDLKECTAGGFKCGNAQGEVVTKELKALTAYTYPSKISSEGREAGIVLSPASGEVLAEFTCLGIPIVVRGSMLVGVSPVMVQTKTLALKIKQTRGKPELSEYETESGAGAATGLTLAVQSKTPDKCALGDIAPTTLAFTEKEVTIEA